MFSGVRSDLDFYWKGPQTFSTVFRLNAVNCELVLFILNVNWPSLTYEKRSIQETSPNSLYRIQYAAIHIL